MKLALVATGRWASMGPGFAQVFGLGAWLSLLQLDHSPLGALAPKVSLLSRNLPEIRAGNLPWVPKPS